MTGNRKTSLSEKGNVIGHQLFGRANGRGHETKRNYTILNEKVRYILNLIEKMCKITKINSK